MAVTEPAPPHVGRAPHKIVTFLALTALLSLPCYRAIATSGDARGLATLLLVFCPGLAGLLTRLLWQRDLRGMGWGRGRARWRVLAWLLPFGYALAVYVPAWALGGGRFDLPHAGAAVADVATETFGISLRLPPAVGVGLYAAFCATAGVLAAGVAAFGEELGWRGVLTPELLQVTTPARAALLTGLIWGAWHFPLFIWADYGGDTPLRLGLACFTVATVADSFILVWLRLKSGSLWTAVLYHASFNVAVLAVFDPLTVPTPLTPYLLGECGLGLVAAEILVAWLLWRRLDVTQRKGEHP